MRRVLFEIPELGFRIPGFGLAMLLACGTALFVTAWRARRERLDPEAVYELAIWLMSGGFIGARTLYIIAHPESIQHFSDIFKIWQGGIVFYGCILGGLLGSILYWSRHPFPFLPMADAVAPALVLGTGIGRVGCFLNGCCFGAVSRVPWAVSFPAGSPPWARHVHEGLISFTATTSCPIHPTQLYSVLDGLVLFALLTIYYPRRRRDGEVMALLMTMYPITRFLIESLRDDEPALLVGLTLSQLISVAIFIAAVVFWLYLSRRPGGRYADRTALSSTTSINETSSTHSSWSCADNQAPVVRPRQSASRKKPKVATSPRSIA
jgi:phosphatidylglycerol:prolipoprotein diacylglycerol transferase